MGPALQQIRDVLFGPVILFFPVLLFGPVPPLALALYTGRPLCKKYMVPLSYIGKTFIIQWLISMS